MSAKTILVVEDEAGIREMIRFSLDRAGYTVVEAEHAAEAEAALADRLPDLILLDWMLPGRGGLELARRWKREEYSRDIPIIMLTARSEESDKVQGLEAGADDYVTKPFSPRELIARIRAVLRRSAPEGDAEVLQAGELRMDLAGHRAYLRDQSLDLGPTEFRLLQFFLSRPERVFSRTQLLDQVWGRSAYIEERTVDVHILRLRKALSPHGYERCIQTVRGAGYRFSLQGLE